MRLLTFPSHLGRSPVVESPGVVGFTFLWVYVWLVVAIIFAKMGTFLWVLVVAIDEVFFDRLWVRDCC